MGIMSGRNPKPMNPFQRVLRTGSVLAAIAAIAVTRVFAAEYFPPAGDWEHRRPDQLGLDSLKMQQAVDYARANDNPANKDMAALMKQTFGKNEPNFKLLGPTQPRAPINGLVVHKGYIV